MHNDNDDEMIEIYSRDSESSGSGSQSSRYKANAVAQQSLSAALAAGPPSTTATNPVTLYKNINNPPTSQSGTVDRNFQDDTVMSRPSDEESSYGPSYFNPSPQMNLGGNANDVLNDLNDLSAQIDNLRKSHSSSSLSGRAAIRSRR